MIKIKTLCIRVDRIGDLVLTLPADQNLKDPSSATWLVNRGLGFVPQSSAPKRKFAETTRDFSLPGFFKLVDWLKSEGFGRAIVFHAPWWISLALFWVGVPIRAGRRSQWHSFLFLNAGVRQSRKARQQNELSFNHELVTQLEGGEIQSTSPLQLVAPKEPGDIVLELKDQAYVVVHPGMGGSALNWPTQHYRALILDLAKVLRVVITGTLADRQFLEPLSDIKDNNVIWLNQKLSAEELLSILGGAKAVVAPSTGVVHLAASLGVPTFGIYSPVPGQSVRRWGPQGRVVETFSPRVECPASSVCLGATCRHFDCMEKIAVSDLLASLGPYLRSSDDKRNS